MENIIAKLTIAIRTFFKINDQLIDSLGLNKNQAPSKYIIYRAASIIIVCLMTWSLVAGNSPSDESIQPSETIKSAAPKDPRTKTQIFIAEQEAKEEAIKKAARIAAQQAQKQALINTCKGDKECIDNMIKRDEYFNQHKEAAIKSCVSEVEKDVNGEIRWKDGGRFSSYIVNTLRSEIILKGNNLEKLASIGVWEQIAYSCIFNAQTNIATAKTEISNP